MTPKIIRFAIHCSGLKPEIVEQMYKEWNTEEKVFIYPSKVEMVITKHFGVTKYRTYKRSRELPYMYHRQLIQYFMNRLTKLSDRQIGKRTGGYDCTSVINNCKVIRNYIDTDKFKRAEIDEIELKLTT